MDQLYSTITHYPSYRENNLNFSRRMVDKITEDIFPAMISDVNREREKMGGINISNYLQLKNDYSCFLSITKERTTVPKDTVTVDSFVFVTSPYMFDFRDGIA